MFLPTLGVLLAELLFQVTALEELKLETCKIGEKNQDCQYWKNHGDCTGGLWKSWMTYYCPVSCNVCISGVNTCLARHNLKRKRHRSPPLVWDRQLEAASQSWAHHLAHSIRYMKHSSGRSYGENLYRKQSPSVGTCEEGVEAWYDEIKDYNFDKPGFSSKTGHFTQVVWKSTTKVGCGRSHRWLGYRRLRDTFVVCRYMPAGNVLGKFEANVLRP